MFVFRLANAKFCNCAGCNREILGASQTEQVELAIEQGQVGLPPLVAGRISEGPRDAPYCPDCLDVRRPSGRTSGLVPRMAAKLRMTNS